MALIRTAGIALLVLLVACGGSTERPAAQAEATGPVDGQRIFNTQCALCHGRQGDKTLSGAKLLNKSVRTREEMIGIVTYGKGAMMPYKDLLAPREIEAVVDHALTLRTP